MTEREVFQKVKIKLSERELQIVGAVVSDWIESKVGIGESRALVAQTAPTSGRAQVYRAFKLLERIRTRLITPRERYIMTLNVSEADTLMCVLREQYQIYQGGLEGVTIYKVSEVIYKWMM